jgi:hypothetical protein
VEVGPHQVTGVRWSKGWNSGRCNKLRRLWLEIRPERLSATGSAIIRYCYMFQVRALLGIGNLLRIEIPGGVAAISASRNWDSQGSAESE